MKHEEWDSLAGERQIDNICDDFEEALQASGNAEIETYLTSIDGSGRPRLLKELLRVEFAYLNGSGTEFSIEDYHRRFPDHVDVVNSAFSSVFDAPIQRPASMARPLSESTGNGNTKRNVRAHQQSKHSAIRRFGNYELLAEVARGGMGVVYRARQIDLDRVVALKMILPVFLSSSEAVERFHTETQTAGRLDHPAIVPIYEVGSHDGELYFTMRFIDGQSLEDELKSDDLPQPRQAADLIRRCAEAVQFAHDKGVVHRDLKPANILVDSQGKPHITDFGLAKLLGEDSNLTRTGHVVGTPGYMAPEQASGKHNGVGIAADVYSLGAVLYRQLTGSPPFRSANVVDTLDQVINEEPIPPRQINASVERDLETICLKCLQKVPSRRFITAGALAEDLARWMAGEPIVSRPISGWQKGLRWCHRNRSMVAILTVMFIFTMGMLGIFMRQREAESRAELETTKRLTAQQLADLNEYHAIINRVTATISQSSLGWKADCLKDLCRAATIATDARNEIELRNLTASCLGKVALRHLTAIVDGNYHAFCTRFSPDGTQIALGGYGDFGKASIRFYSVSSGKLRHEMWYDAKSPNRKTGAWAMAYSPDGNWLIIGARDGMMHAIDTATYEITSWAAHESRIRDVDVHPLGNLAVSCAEDKHFAGWQIGSWDRVFSKDMLDYCNNVAFTPDGRMLACAINRGVHYFETATLSGSDPEVTKSRSELTLRFAMNPLFDLEASADAYSIRLRPVGRDSFEYRLRHSGLHGFSHLDQISHIEFSPNGHLVVSASEQEEFCVWEVCSRRAIARVAVFSMGNVCPTFSPDGKLLAVATDRAVNIYRIDGFVEQTPITSHAYQLRAFAFSPDGSRIACVSVNQRYAQVGDTVITLWDAKSGNLLKSVDAPKLYSHIGNENYDITFDPSGSRVVCSGSNLALVWDFERLTQFPVGLYSRYVSVECLKDGLRFLVSCLREMKSWRFDGKESLTSWSNEESKRRSGHGNLSDIVALDDAVLVGSRDSAVRCFNPETLELSSQWETIAPVEAIAVNNTELMVASGMQNGMIQINRRQNGKRPHHFQAHAERVNDVAFSPKDSNLLASASKDGTVVLWNVTEGTANKLMTLPSLTGQSVDQLQFTPDGRKLAILLFGETSIRLWDLVAVRKRLAEMGLDW